MIMKKQLSLESKIKDFIDYPIGKDLIEKICLMGHIPYGLISKGPVANLKLKTLSKLASGKLDPRFFDSLLNLVNSEKATVTAQPETITRAWWKEAVFYQIYPKSFADSNNDGIGDLKGIISKLDYLKEIGINCIWLSPIYDSPMDDNGYDIRDYKKILDLFGTMEDFDLLLEQAHKKGIKIIMDLVVNHTSDEHQWFKKAVENPQSKYHDYYIFRKKPNNWQSFFSEGAWNYYKENDEYGLHLFSRKQMDLNWDNPEVRNEVIEMIKWWLQKGVDGFRMDVINLISKVQNLPDGSTTIGALTGLTGLENYFYGPNLHQYLHEIQEKAFSPYGAFSVGETPAIGTEMIKLIVAEERHELNMTFSFDHLESDGHSRFDIYKYDLNFYRDYVIKTLGSFGNACWLSLFYNNHDNPKMCSKIDPAGKWTSQIQKLLAVMQFTLRGTPFVFQGDEMGIANYKFDSIDQITDIESKNMYKALLQKGMTPEDAMKTIQEGTREHGRILLPWNTYNEQNKQIGLQQKINTEITELYKKLIKFRNQNKDTIVYGSFSALNTKKNRFTYMRGNSIIVDCNLSEEKTKAYKVPKNFRRLFLTQDDRNTEEKKLLPYEARIYVLNTGVTDEI